MRRPLVLLLGLGCLLLAGLVRPPPPRGGSPLQALGRSLGGWRVLVVDMLALRVEALRRQGRQDELPQMCQAMVELDPGNAAGTETLADLIATQVLPLAATPALKRDRWLEAWGLVEQGLVAHPTSALLAVRASALLLEVAEGDAELEAAVDALHGSRSRREALGLGYLLAAARAEEHLRRSGRAHLVALAREAPRLAAQALIRGQSETEVLARLGAADELRALHPAALAEIEELIEPSPEHPEGRRIALLERLAAQEALMRAALRARAAGSPGTLGATLDEVEARVGRTPTSRVLRTWSRGS